MDRNLLYRLSVTGQAEAIRHIRTFYEQVMKITADETKAVAGAVAAQTRARRAGLSEQERMQRDAFRINVQSRNRQVKEAEKAERAQVAAAQKTAKDMDRVFASMVKDFEKSEKAKTRIADREAKERQRIERQTQQFVQRAQEASMRREMQVRQQSQRQAERDALRRARDEAFDDKRFYRGLGHSFVGAATDTMRQVTGYAVKGARAVAGGLGMNAALDVQDIIAERMHGQQLMRAAAIEARTAGSAFGASGFNENAAMAKVKQAAASTGLSQRDLFQAIDVYSEKGSGQTAVENIDRIARQAKAMGTEASVIAKLRAQMGISSRITGEYRDKAGNVTEMSEEQKDALIAKMHFIGKTGVFRAEDIAQESESLFSQFAKSGMSFDKGFERYISFANEARKATGSGAMARTAINSVQDAIAKKEDKLHALGVSTRYTDKEGIEHNRDFIDIAIDAIEKTGGKGKAFNQIFDPSRSGKALSTMITAAQSAGGGKAGTAAIHKLLAGDDSIKAATTSEMEKDAAYAINSEGNKLKMSVERVRQSFGDAIAPALDKLANRMPDIVDKVVAAIGKLPSVIDKVVALFEKLPIGKILDFAIEHPVASLLAVNAAPKVGAFAAGRLGDALVNTVPTLAGKLGGRAGAIAGGVAGLVGGTLSQAGSTPVFITGAAPGVLGGGGILDAVGGVGGAGGAGGGAAGGGTLARVAAAVGGGAKLAIGGTAAMALTMGDYERNLHVMTSEQHAKLRDERRQKFALQMAKGEATQEGAEEIVEDEYEKNSSWLQYYTNPLSEEERTKRAKKLLAGRHAADAGETSGAGGLAGDVARSFFTPEAMKDTVDRPTGNTSAVSMEGFARVPTGPAEQGGMVQQGGYFAEMLKPFIDDLKKAGEASSKLTQAMEAMNRAMAQQANNISAIKNAPGTR